MEFNIEKCYNENKQIELKNAESFYIYLKLVRIKPDIKAIKKYIKDGNDPSVYDNYAITWASLYGHTEIVKLLIKDKRVDPTIYDNQAIKHACHYNRKGVINLLLSDKRVDPSTENNSAIKWASNHKRPHIVYAKLNNFYL